jgi:hypothetical protein
VIAIVNSYIDTRTNSFHSAGWRALFLSSGGGLVVFFVFDDDDDDWIF